MIEELSTALEQKQFYEIKIDKYTPSRERVFKIQPKVAILKSNNSNESLIEVICRDRHGLLAVIAKVLYSLNISIKAAKIVTVGARAEFSYWLSTNNHALGKAQLEKLKQQLLEQL
jgi:[protein-PII] uridylyltransferase